MGLKPCFLIILFIEIIPFIALAQIDTLKTDSSLVDLPGVVVSASRRLFHAEMQHDLTETLLRELNSKYKLELMYGFDFREYIVVPDGNYFINPEKEGENLHYWKAGGFAQATKYFFKTKLKLNAVLRVEKNKYFDAKFSPRIAAVYSPVQTHKFPCGIPGGLSFSKFV